MKKGELWILDFPSKTEREQAGTRPAIVMADTGTDLALVIPLTSNLQALNKLPNTLRINRSDENNLDKDSIALAFQLQALDKKRFITNIGNLKESYLKEINKILKNLLKL